MEQNPNNNRKAFSSSFIHDYLKDLKCPTIILFNRRSDTNFYILMESGEIITQKFTRQMNVSMMSLADQELPNERPRVEHPKQIIAPKLFMATNF